MKEVWNPTHEEIKEWAYRNEPTEDDWDLAITKPENAELLFVLATEERCPKKSFFLSCLYLLVGDYVRCKGKGHNRTIIDGLLEYTEHFNDKKIKEWAERSKQLINNPDTFDYQLWCNGGYAYAN
jgi:hypothetical protein